MKEYNFNMNSWAPPDDDWPEYIHITSSCNLINVKYSCFFVFLVCRTICKVVAEYLGFAPSRGQELELQFINVGMQALTSVLFVGFIPFQRCITLVRLH